MAVKYKQELIHYTCITLGVFLLAAAVVVFFEPRRMVTGGVSGLAIIIGDYSARAGFPVPVWMSNLLLNVPLFLVALKTMEKRFLWRTAFATALFSVALYAARFIPPIPDDILLSALFGGALSGLGLGLVFMSVATTGGSDLAAGVLHHRWFRHISMAKILFVLDAGIILFGLFVFGPAAAMYAVVAVFVSTKATDALLEGLSFAKAAFIISDHAEAIAGTVLSRMARGATALAGRGMYTGARKDVLLCVVSAKELVTLKELVREADARAFVVVADVREVLGEGF